MHYSTELTLCYLLADVEDGVRPGPWPYLIIVVNCRQLQRIRHIACDQSGNRDILSETYLEEMPRVQMRPMGRGPL